MEHIVTFRKFRFYHPHTPSAIEITKKYQGTFKTNLKILYLLCSIDSLTVKLVLDFNF